jgi:hypothetical protein
VTGTWRSERLPELVRALAGRPRHEALRGHVTELLRSGFGAPYEEIGQEVYLLDGAGRIDTMWGATVIELKSDLKRELDDVLARLPVYLADAASRSRSPRPVTGLATDGATFIAYALRDGTLHELARYATDPERPNELMAWLEPLLSDRPDILPEPRAVVQAFGRASLTFGQSRMALDALWAVLRDDPEVRLKRDLWDGLLREAYGEDVGEDALFLQHTYLTIVVKAIAARVLDLPVTDPAALLSGRALADEGILGAVEADFFDWPLKMTAGAELVRHVALQTARFRLRDVEADVLKILYESLVDPDERHDLGEYYTPDWLAAWIIAAAVDAPLEQRVLDPACGSGTFVFHAVRQLIAAGRAAGWPGPRILEACEEKVRGLDGGQHDARHGAASAKRGSRHRRRAQNPRIPAQLGAYGWRSKSTVLHGPRVHRGCLGRAASLPDHPGSDECGDQNRRYRMGTALYITPWSAIVRRRTSSIRASGPFGKWKTARRAC